MSLLSEEWPTREQRVKHAFWLRDRFGLNQKQIALRMGASRSTVSAYFTDPDLSVQRRRRRAYSRPCPNCGTPMDGSCGPTCGPKLCKTCAQAAQADPANHRWQPELIIELMQRWARQHGRRPNSNDWRTTHLWRDEQGEYKTPCAGSVYGPTAPWDKWADALAAAGFEHVGVGLYKRVGMVGVGRCGREVLGLLADGPLSTREIADIRGSGITTTFQVLDHLRKRGLVTGQRLPTLGRPMLWSVHSENGAY